MQEVSLNEESWDKKKVILGILILVVLIGGVFGVKNFVLGKDLSKGRGSIKGISIERDINQSLQMPSSNSEISEKATSNNQIPLSTNRIQTEVQKKLETIKQEIRTLNVVELASSSPQVQKIITEIKTLEKYPTNQARDMCEKICSGI